MNELDTIQEKESECEKFAEFVVDEINGDEEPLSKVGYNLIEAYNNNDCDDLLIALCGWSMQSLIERFYDRD